MADDTDNLTIYRSDRAGNVMRVSRTETGFKLTATGGDNIKQAEYDQIATFVAGGVGAEAFLAKIAARMER